MKRYFLLFILIIAMFGYLIFVLFNSARKTDSLTSPVVTPEIIER